MRVTDTAVHPGGIRTELTRHLGDGALEAMVGKINEELAAQGKSPFELKSIPQGAATSVWAGFVAAADEVGGLYCDNCHVATVTENPASRISEGVRAYALDAERAKALWSKSEEMIGERF
ncbi:hypothetical protein [Agrobacterium fabrum]|uniref:hypothetical protein n=1 Tax=Agrobacterium fabrum TaxID=1176649 RepID=UPI003BA344C2